MAEVENKTPEVTPPKLTPITPATKPAVPGAPRPISIHPHRPVIHKPGTVHAAPGATPAAPKPVTPAAQKPITPATPKPVTPAAAPKAPQPQAAQPGGESNSTIRIRPITSVKPKSPITPVAAAPAVTPATAAKPITPLKPQSPPVPGAHPLPAGPKPPSAAQVQAAKSKTSRISLDSAIGVAPVGNTSPKTIKLKRPVDLGMPKSVSGSSKSATAQLHQTSRIPEAAAPNDGASVTQKKTLKIKRPGLAHKNPQTEGAAEGEAPATDEPVFQNLTPINSADFGGKKESNVFTGIAIAVAAIAVIVLFLLNFCLGTHAMGPAAGPNSLATIPGPELPWVGRIAD